MKPRCICGSVFFCLTLASAQYSVEWTSANLGSYGWGGAYGYDVDNDGLVEFEVRANAQFIFYNGSYSSDWTINFPGYNYVYAVHPRDTDGDGRVIPLNTDADPAGELVVTGYYLSGSTYYGRIRVYDASSHNLEWESPLITGFSGSATEEDIDNDGRCEIIITRYTSTDSYVDVYNCTTDIAEDNPKYEVASSVKVYPNPATAIVRIPFSVALKEAGSAMNVSIYDDLGRRVRVLSDERSAVPGDYRLIWDGQDDNGRDASSGNYFVQVRVGDNVSRQTVSLIRR
jgi:hypothetical protein